MGRRIDVTFVTADGMECAGQVEADSRGRPPMWFERCIRTPISCSVAPRELPSVRDRVYTRRYELNVWRPAGGGPDVWKYVEVSPQAYSKEVDDLRLANAELEVDNGLLRARLRELTTAPSTGASA